MLPNKISLSSFPNHLTNPEDLVGLYLLELINLEPQEQKKLKSEPHLSMLFADISATTEEENPQIAKTPEMEEVNLLMMSPME